MSTLRSIRLIKVSEETSERHFRVAGTKLANQWGQYVQHDRRCGIHAQQALGPLAALHQRIFRRGHIAQDFLHLAEWFLPPASGLSGGWCD